MPFRCRSASVPALLVTTHEYVATTQQSGPLLLSQVLPFPTQCPASQLLSVQTGIWNTVSARVQLTGMHVMNCEGQSLSQWSWSPG